MVIPFEETDERPSWVERHGGEGIQTGLLIAAAGAPGTFEPSLVPRSLLDQGLITGLAGTLSYVLTTATQDAIEAMASLVVAPQPAATALMRRRRATLALDLIAIPLGLAAHQLWCAGTTRLCSAGSFDSPRGGWRSPDSAAWCSRWCEPGRVVSSPPSARGRG